MGRLRFIDLTAGIGAGALGFQKAGFEVVCAVVASETDKSICGNLVDVQNIIVGKTDTIDPDELPEADVIAARLLNFGIPSETRRVGDEETPGNRAVVRALWEKKPAFFVLEAAVGMLTGNRLKETVRSLGEDLRRRYYIQYRIFDESKYSGFPVTGKEAFIIGIRSDLFREEFYFPSEDIGKRKVLLERAETVDKWYRQIKKMPDIPINEGYYYIRRLGSFSETDKITLSFLQEMYLADSVGFRRFTHNECAALKGIDGYDFDHCSNRHEMYRKISRSSNAYTIRAIANEIRKYLKQDVGAPAHAERRAKSDREKTQRKLSENTEPVNDILYPELTLV